MSNLTRFQKDNKICKKPFWYRSEPEVLLQATNNEDYICSHHAQDSPSRFSPKKNVEILIMIFATAGYLPKSVKPINIFKSNSTFTNVFLLLCLSIYLSICNQNPSTA